MCILQGGETLALGDYLFYQMKLLVIYVFCTLASNFTESGP